jgi:hypothetical protein
MLIPTIGFAADYAVPGVAVGGGDTVAVRINAQV